MGSIVKRGLKYMAIVSLGEYKYRPIKSTLPTKNLAKYYSIIPCRPYHCLLGFFKKYKR